MVAYSDTAHEFDQATAVRQALKKSSAVNKTGRVFLGSVLLISGVGLWLVPVDAGDSAMRLIKLFLSLVLMALGAMFIASLKQKSGASEIQVDAQNRELRIYNTNETGQSVLAEKHKLDDLNELALMDGLLTARDAQSKLLFSVPVEDRRSEKMLRAALEDIR